jgi:glycine C-acetyltransferase
LWANGKFLNDELTKMGFNTGASQTPIIPVILGEAHLAKDFSARLLDEGVFAKSISFPTVPHGTARIRVMNSAAHTQSDLEQALAAFETVGKALGVIG